METRSNILVPTDFSYEADCATAHAAKIAGRANDAVVLLHVINKETKADLKKNRETTDSLVSRLQKLVDAFKAKYKLDCSFVLREGSIFTVISEVAEEMKSSLIVMGTHGVVGVQHLVGAYALKVVASSKIPVVVVQGRFPAEGEGFRIVSPIDFTVETKQKTLQTIAIAKTFGAEVHLYKQFASDEAINNRIQLNNQFVKRHLEEQGVTVIESGQPSSGDFAKDFIRYAKDASADLIVILTTVDKGLKDMLVGPMEQQVINNSEQIAVMCVNPLQNIFRQDRLGSAIHMAY